MKCDTVSSISLVTCESIKTKKHSRTSGQSSSISQWFAVAGLRSRYYATKGILRALSNKWDGDIFQLRYSGRVLNMHLRPSIEFNKKNQIAQKIIDNVICSFVYPRWCRGLSHRNNVWTRVCNQKENAMSYSRLSLGKL